MSATCVEIIKKIFCSEMPNFRFRLVIICSKHEMANSAWKTVSRRCSVWKRRRWRRACLLALLQFVVISSIPSSSRSSSKTKSNVASTPSVIADFSTAPLGLFCCADLHGNLGRHAGKYECRVAKTLGSRVHLGSFSNLRDFLSRWNLNCRLHFIYWRIQANFSECFLMTYI